jgi:hypothetical protein
VFISTFLEADKQATELVQPSKVPPYNPAESPQSAAVPGIMCATNGRMRRAHKPPLRDIVGAREGKLAGWNQSRHRPRSGIT